MPFARDVCCGEYGGSRAAPEGLNDWQAPRTWRRPNLTRALCSPRNLDNLAKLDMPFQLKAFLYANVSMF